MLAEPLDYERDADGNPTFREAQFQWFAEPKLDGIRCILYLDHDHNKALTRVKGKHTGAYADKAPHLPWLKVAGHFKDLVVLDGELTWGDHSRDCMSVLGCEPRKAWERQEGMPVVFKAFDLLYANGLYHTAKPYEARHEQLLHYAFDLMERGFPVDVVMPGPARSLWARASEGIMLKAPGHQYWPKKRSPDWLKVKRYKKYVAVVTLFTWGKEGKTGNMLGLMGSLQLSMLDGRGILVAVGGCGTGFEMYERNPGAWPPRTVVEVESSDVTEDGKLWHPRFIRRRPDLRVEDALLTQLEA